VKPGPISSPSRLRGSRWTAPDLLFLLLALVGLAALLYPFWAPAQPPLPETRLVILVFSGGAALVLIGLVGEAQAGLTAHTIAMLGTLVGLNTILRVIETVIPMPGGFSPVFLLIILVGHAFGARLGFLMGSLTMLVSGPLTAGGLGPWTPYQMLVAGFVGMGASWLPTRRARLAALAAYATLWGWTYGALTNLYFWPYAVLAPDLAWSPELSLLDVLSRYGRFYLVTSLAWDTLRAGGNLILIVVLARPLLKALERFRARARVTWEPVEAQTPQV
jgi:energy-coupling factor transport system substrate-specific component